MQIDWTGTLFRDAWAGGNHSLKFGMLSEREGQYFRDEGFLGHYRTLFNSASGVDFTTPYRIQIYNTPYESQDWMWHHGAFVNDQIQRGRVTFNVGLRWDYYGVAEVFATTPVEVELVNLETPTDLRRLDFGPKRDPMRPYQPDANNVGPRAGFAWTLGEDESTVIRGGLGSGGGAREGGQSGQEGGGGRVLLTG